uniref:Pecanex-like protein n=1 Tax=Mesocestoides corti TaxID=53468 RepID=A0A5K3F1Y9_MESCO
ASCFKSDPLRLHTTQPIRPLLVRHADASNLAHISHTHGCNVVGEDARPRGAKLVEDKSRISSPSSASLNLSDLDDDPPAIGRSRLATACTDNSHSRSAISPRLGSPDYFQTPNFTAVTAGSRSKSHIPEPTTDLTKYRLNYPSLLATVRRLVSGKAAPNATQTLGPFAEEILRQRVDTSPPNTWPMFDVVDNGITQIRRQWKCRYYALLDAVDLLYKDYQLLYRVSENQRRVLTSSMVDRLLASHISKNNLEAVVF